MQIHQELPPKIRIILQPTRTNGTSTKIASPFSRKFLNPLTRCGPPWARARCLAVFAADSMWRLVLLAAAQGRGARTGRAEWRWAELGASHFPFWVWTILVANKKFGHLFGPSTQVGGGVWSFLGGFRRLQMPSGLLRGRCFATTTAAVELGE